jgi:para-nitrobenzyl esterase
MKKTIISLLILVAAIVLVVLVLRSTDREPALPTADASSLRQTASGSVIGFRDGGDTHAWLGLPYAQAPIGALRWRAPQTATAWSGTREALSYAAPCIQLWGPTAGVDGDPGQVVGNEDCLYLNIWAPAFAPEAVPQAGAQLPVMVWIHGGGNAIGTANTYQGHQLASKQRVIFVAINYRLGVLGWFSHQALRQTSAELADASGNYGILDMIGALQWLRHNIAAFGGDPDNITIFGESAGGRNVYALLGSPLADGMFHKAISQSGSARTTKLSVAENLRDASTPGMSNSSSEVLLRLLQADGRADDRGQAIAALTRMDAAAINDYLRQQSAAELYAVFEDLGYGMFLIPQNFRDGHVLPHEALLQRFREPAHYNSVPVILGSNRDENKSFMAQDPRYVERRFGLLPRVVDQTWYDHMAAYHSDQWKALAVDEPAQVLSSSQPGAVYAYRFDWDEAPSTWMADFPRLLGAGHGLEVSFVFGDFEGGISVPYLMSDDNEAGRLALSQAMMNYWGQFAHTGDPGQGRAGESPRWTPWGTGAQTFLVLDTPEGGGIHMSTERMTAEALKQRLADDPLLEAPEQRCRLYAELFLLSYQTTEYWDTHEYQSLANGACRDISPFAFLESG